MNYLFPQEDKRKKLKIKLKMDKKFEYTTATLILEKYK